MNIDYVVANPTGNITVLVTTPVSQNERLKVVDRMFKKEPTCEQVGFITVLGDTSIKLEMMGGEFCGNATISSASYLASIKGLELKHQQLITVESSGNDHPVTVLVKRIAEDAFIGTLEMPIPSMTYYAGYPLVSMDGISHLMVPMGKLTDSELEQKVKTVAQELEALALGIMQYEETENGVTIQPLVYVQKSNTLVWEHGCASGSIAAAYYCYSEDNSKREITIRQPGGMTRVAIRADRTLYTGMVTIADAKFVG